MDYTKASNGFQLVPKLETVCLRDALLSPIGIITYQQSKIKIDLDYISDDISRNIITDNPWLQENVLCLLSNAVKYSIGGSVRVSASLIEQTNDNCCNDVRSTKTVCPTDSDKRDSVQYS